MLILRPDTLSFNPAYLTWTLKNDAVQRTFKHISSGCAQPQLPIRSLKSLKIPLPPLETQQRIVELLDRAQALIDKRKEQIKLMDDLIQSLFYDMFGDPVTNPMGWDIDSLASFGSLKNGLNFSKGETGVKVRYLGVGDFGKHSKISCIESLSLVDLTTLPSEDYFLRNGDVLFVRSNGNKKLVGRCIVVYPGDEKVSYSGFCIRYRIEISGLTPTYLAHLFRMQSFRLALLQDGQGANIQNINQRILAALKIPSPPIDLQNTFAQRVEKIEAQKQAMTSSLKELEDNFNGLMQRAFKGELDI